MLQHLVAGDEIEASVREWEAFAIQILFSELEAFGDIGEEVTRATNQIDPSRGGQPDFVPRFQCAGELTEEETLPATNVQDPNRGFGKFADPSLDRGG